MRYPFHLIGYKQTISRLLIILKCNAYALEGPTNIDTIQWTEMAKDPISLWLGISNGWQEKWNTFLACTYITCVGTNWYACYFGCLCALAASPFWGSSPKHVIYIFVCRTPNNDENKNRKLQNETQNLANATQTKPFGEGVQIGVTHSDPNSIYTYIYTFIYVWFS